MDFFLVAGKPATTFRGCRIITIGSFCRPGGIDYDFSGKGISNFLLSNGDILIAHCSILLSYIVRQAPSVMPICMSVDFRQSTTPPDRVAVITLMTLIDNESWVDMRPGTLWMPHDGGVCAQRDTLPSSYKSMEEMNACQG